MGSRWRARSAMLVAVAVLAAPAAALLGPAVAGADPGSSDLQFGTSGVVTTSFGTGATDQANAEAIQSTGKIVVAGSDQPAAATTPKTIAKFAVARYDTDGSLDTTFGTGGKVTTDIGGATGNGDVAFAVAVESDGDVVAGGYTSKNTTTTGIQQAVLVRYKPTGALDTTFGTGGIATLTIAGSTTFSQINGLVVDGTGRIVVAGESDLGWLVARFTPTGHLDTTFNSAGTQPGVQSSFPATVTTVDVANAVAISTGKIVVTGSTGNGAGVGVAELNADGTLNTSFATTGLTATTVGASPATGNGVAIQTDGDIVVTGQAGTKAVVVRYTPTGPLDTSFGAGGIVTTSVGPNMDAVGRSVAVESDGKIVVGGYTDVTALQRDLLVLRYQSNGSLDSSFGSTGIVATRTGPTSHDAGNAVALEPGGLGQIVAAGSDQPSGGTQRFLLAGYYAAFAPTVTKAFGAASVPLGTTTSLTVTITNPNTTGSLTGLSFTDTLAGGLTVAATPALSNTCGGSVTGASAGSGAVGLTGGTVVASSSCHVVVTVLGTSVGVKHNSVTVGSTQGGASNTATATLTVVAPPTITKAFTPSTVKQGSTTQLNFDVTNPNATTTLHGVGFNDTVPLGLTVPTLSASVCGGLFTATAPRTITVTGITLAPGASCPIGVTVTAPTAGSFTNVSGHVTSTEGGAGLTATAILTVAAPPTIAKAFGVATLPLNGSTTLTFTLTNPAANTVAETGVAFSDSLPAGLEVATPNGVASTCGPGVTAVPSTTTVSLSGGTIATTATCTISVKVIGTTPGVKDNTTGNVSSTNGGTGNTASASVTVVTPPTATKTFGTTSIPVGETTSLTIKVTNPNATTALAGVAFTDSLPAGLVVATPNGRVGTCGGSITAIAGSSTVSLSGGSVAASSTCSVKVNVEATAAGVQHNSVTVTSTNGGTGLTATATLTVVAPPTIAKAFSPTTIAKGSTSTLTFTLTNPVANTVAETGVAFTDTLPSGLTVPTATTSKCGGTLVTTAPGTVALSGATIAVSGTCTFTVTVTGTTAGTLTNTTGAVTSTNGGTGLTASATVLVIQVPSAPLGVSAIAPSATALVNGAQVSWTAPADDGGSPVTGYTVAADDLTLGQAGPVTTTTAAARSAQLTGLTAGHLYSFAVAAVNAAGPGPASVPSNPVVPVAVKPNQTATGSSSSPGASATATVGAVGTSGYLSASATGEGTVTVSTYPSDPVSGFATNGVFFDVSVSPGSAFTQLVFTVCGVDAGQPVTWWNPIAQSYVPVSNQAPSATGGCVTVTVTTSTAPDLTQMVGTAFDTQPAAQGYGLTTSNGAVFTFGKTRFAGSLPALGVVPAAPVVGMAVDAKTGGYWLVAADGGVFAFGAPFDGSMGGRPLTAPIVGMAADPATGGYWLVAADGGVFAFDAPFQGSMAGRALNRPVTGMAADPGTGGYWLVAADGGVFAFDAPFLGSMQGSPFNAPMVGITAKTGSPGYWLAGGDGGVFAFGDAQFAGSLAQQNLTGPVTAIGH